MRKMFACLRKWLTWGTARHHRDISAEGGVVETPRIELMQRPTLYCVRVVPLI